jgi:hypothetical protein
MLINSRILQMQRLQKQKMPNTFQFGTSMGAAAVLPFKHFIQGALQARAKGGNINRAYHFIFSSSFFFLEKGKCVVHMLSR